MSRSTRNLAILVACALAGASGLAAAQTKDQKQAAKAAFEQRFKAADKNGDGGLSKDELAAAKDSDFDAIRKNFDAMDTNKDGKVTIEERRDFARASKKK